MSKQSHDLSLISWPHTFHPCRLFSSDAFLLCSVFFKREREEGNCNLLAMSRKSSNCVWEAKVPSCQETNDLLELTMPVLYPRKFWASFSHTEETKTIKTVVVEELFERYISRSLLISHFVFIVLDQISGPKDGLSQSFQSLLWQCSQSTTDLSSWWGENRFERERGPVVTGDISSLTRGANFDMFWGGSNLAQDHCQWHLLLIQLAEIKEFFTLPSYSSFLFTPGWQLMERERIRVVVWAENSAMAIQLFANKRRQLE